MKQQIVRTLLKEYSSKYARVISDELIDNMYQLSATSNKLLRDVWNRRPKQGHTVEKMFLPGDYLSYNYKHKQSFHRDKNKLIGIGFMNEYTIDAVRYFVVLPWAMHYIGKPDMDNLKKECKYHVPLGRWTHKEF